MLTVRNATQAIDFYTRAFGAVEVSRLTTPTWQIVAEMSIEGLPFFVVDDPDAVAKPALAAGATEVFPDRGPTVRDAPGPCCEDPYGHHWLIGKPLTPA